MKNRTLSNWLAGYREYTSETEPPPAFHLWTGIAVISAALRRLNWLDFWPRPIYPNLYCVLTGPPGVGKGVALGMGTSVLREVTSIRLCPQAITREAFLMDLEASAMDAQITTGKMLRHSSMSVFSSEFSVFLGKAEPRFIAELCDLYDCPTPDFSNRLKTKPGNMIPNPCVTLMAGTTPTWLQTSIPLDAVGGGLAARTIFVTANQKGHRVEWCDPVAIRGRLSDITKALIVDLEQIAGLRGPYHPDSNMIDFQSQWYRQLPETSAEGVQGSFAERLRVHALKVAMCFSASRGNDKIISLEDFQAAVSCLGDVQEQLPKLFMATGRSRYGPDMVRIARQIAARKEHGITFSELLAINLGDLTERDLHQTVIPNLVLSGQVHKSTDKYGTTRYHIGPQPGGSDNDRD